MSSRPMRSGRCDRGHGGDPPPEERCIRVCVCVCICCGAYPKAKWEASGGALLYLCHPWVESIVYGGEATCLCVANEGADLLVA